MATQENRRALTRQKILDAASELFLEHGFENTTITQIVKRANVVKGTFYQHFQAKVDLLVALGRRDGTGRLRQLIEEVQAGSSPLDALQRFYLAMAQWFEAHAPIAEDVIVSAIRLHNPRSNTPESVAHDFTRLMLQIASKRGEVQHGLDANTQAIVLGGAFTLAVVDWSRNPTPLKLQGVVGDCYRVFLQGVAAAPKSARHAKAKKTRRQGASND